MSARPIGGQAVFFLDRSLGRRQVPEFLRQAGWQIQTLAEEYGIPADESVSDVEWLTMVGERGWPVLMKDDRIRYRPVEREALIAHNVQAFCLIGGNIRAAVMAQRFNAVRVQIEEACQHPGPLLYVVTGQGIRAVPLT